MTELIPAGEERLARAAALVETDPVWDVALLGLRVSLSDPLDVAQAYSDIVNAQRLLDEARGLLTDILRLESLRQASKTLHLSDELTVELTGGKRFEYDDLRLEEMLYDAGMPAERIAELIRTEVVRRVDGRVANQVSRVNPAYAAAIEVCRTERPAAWRVNIQRKGNP
jgi:hypothetical protein